MVLSSIFSRTWEGSRSSTLRSSGSREASTMLTTAALIICIVNLAFYGRQIWNSRPQIGPGHSLRRYFRFAHTAVEPPALTMQV